VESHTQDPVKLFLAGVGLLSHEQVFRGFLDQAAAFRRVDEPEVGDFVVAGAALIISLSAPDLPQHVITRVIRSLSRLPDEKLAAANVTIVDNTYLVLEDGVWELATMRQVPDEHPLTPLYVMVWFMEQLWQKAVTTLSPQPAPAAAAP
jgi:hypothetical protein